MPGAGYCEEFDSDDEENDNHDEEDGPPECLLDCEGIEYINLKKIHMKPAIG